MSRKCQHAIAGQNQMDFGNGG